MSFFLVVFFAHFAVASNFNENVAVVDPDVSEQLRFNETAAVLVALKPAEFISGGKPSFSSAPEAYAGLNVTGRFNSLDLVSAQVTAEGLEALRSDPSVASIFFDRPVYALDAVSNAQIGAGLAHGLQAGGRNVMGRNQTICVIDTGIDYRDPAFGNCPAVGSGGNCRVVGGFDFVNDDADPLDDHGHGTHVAGIAAANGSGFEGVAPGANLVAVKVLNAAGAGVLSDVVAGIDWCTNNRTVFNITVVSLSLGSGLFPNYCDDEPDAVAVQNAFSAGLFVSTASGNAASGSGVSAPACSSKAAAVGAVNSSDSVAVFSNDWANYLLLAPGVLINSSVVGNASALDSGTSMAAPHVSGAAALLQDFAQIGNATLATPVYLRELLNRTGLGVTDSRTGRMHYRLDVFAALQAFQADVTPRNFALATFANASTTLQSYSQVNVSFFDDNLTASACILEWRNGTVTNYSMTVSSGLCSFNVTGQDNVNASFRVYVNDSFGNTGSAFFARSLDTQAPQSVNSTFMNNTILANTSVQVNASFSDLNPHFCVLDLDGVNTTLAANATSCVFNRFVAQGNHNFTVFVNDSFGRTNQSQVFYFTTDVTPPTALSFVAPTPSNSSASSNEFVFINLSFVEARPFVCVLAFNSTVNYSMDLSGANGVAPYCSFNVTNLPEGVHNYSIFLNDSLGQGNVTALRFAVIDRTAPVVSAVSAPRFVNRSAPLTVSANASDLLAQVLNVSVAFTNGSGVMLYSQSFSLSYGLNYSTLFTDVSVLSDGNYTLNFTAMDNASNSASNASVNLTVDSESPTAPILSVQSNASGFVYVNWSASSDNSGLDHYDVFRNGSLVVSTSFINASDWSAPLGFDANYTVRAVDVSGNVNSSAGVIVRVNDTILPRLTGNLTSQNRNDGTVNLTWLNSTLDVNGTAERNVTYRVLRTTDLLNLDVSQMTLLATVSELSYLDESALEPVTTYRYVVVSVDANGNRNESLTSNNSVNHTTVSSCSNAFSDFSTCSGGSQSRTRTCLGRLETQTQACSTGIVGSSVSVASVGSGSSAASAASGAVGLSGGARGGGGGGGGKGSDLFIVQDIPPTLELEPGKRTKTEAQVSSYYTGFLRVRNVTVIGVPDDWYTVSDLSLVSPISKTPFSIQWHPPADASGNYSVRIDIVGVGTKNAGLLNTSYSFQLVLAPLDLAQSLPPIETSRQPVKEAVPSKTAVIPPLVQPARTDYSSFLVVLAVLGLFGAIGGAFELSKWRKHYSADSDLHGQIGVKKETGRPDDG